MHRPGCWWGATAVGAHRAVSGLAQALERRDKAGSVSRKSHDDDLLGATLAGRVQHGVVVVKRDISESQTAQPGGAQREVGIAAERDRDPYGRGRHGGVSRALRSMATSSRGHNAFLAHRGSSDPRTRL